MGKFLKNRSNSLIDTYQNVVNSIVDEFKKKQWPDEEVDGYWVGDFVGELYSFYDSLFLDFNDIFIDIKENAPMGEILRWNEYVNRIWEINDIVGTQTLNKVNYRSWLKGCPIIPLEELDRIEEKWANFKNEVDELSKASAANKE